MVFNFFFLYLYTSTRCVFVQNGHNIHVIAKHIRINDIAITVSKTIDSMKLLELKKLLKHLTFQIKKVWPLTIFHTKFHEHGAQENHINIVVIKI